MTSTDIIRAGYVDPQPWANPARAGIDFDEWLAKHDAEVAGRALTDAAHHLAGLDRAHVRASRIVLDLADQIDPLPDDDDDEGSR